MSANHIPNINKMFALEHHHAIKTDVNGNSVLDVGDKNVMMKSLECWVASLVDKSF